VSEPALLRELFRIKASAPVRVGEAAAAYEQVGHFTPLPAASISTFKGIPFSGSTTSEMARFLHLLSQIPQPKHFSLITAHRLISFPLSENEVITIALNWQYGVHSPQPTQPCSMIERYPDGRSIFMLYSAMNFIPKQQHLQQLQMA
jgi:hypothetical protein